MNPRSKTAVITGASAGIGAAAAARLTQEGFRVVGGARRLDRLKSILDPLGARALPLDVTDPESVAAFVEEVPEVDLLVNNAGGSFCLDSVRDTEEAIWEKTFQVNVMGVVRLTRAFLPALQRSGDGHLINIGSIAGFETYPGGGSYTASKHALRALNRTLRQELLGQPVRVTEIAPGMVETEFSIVRFDGDEERARKVYEGLEPLVAEDIADCIAWAATRPPHVNIDEIVVRPRAQANAYMVHREG